uniref:NXPE C-terminal domain-containing protein n=1 Tax=Ciona savignyi TaxID=51511 RepID=H2ZBR3_CIOSA
GDKLQVNIVARNHRGEQKRYGGDYFRVLLKTDKDTTSVIADITDNLDGTYTAILPLHFSGKARLKVIMIHPSEAIDLLRRVTSTKWSPGLFFSARFKEKNYEENTECNIWLPSMHDEPLYCNFSNTKTGEPWYCEKPKKLGCDAFISYGMARTTVNVRGITATFFTKHTHVQISSLIQESKTMFLCCTGGDVYNRPLCTASKAGNLPPRPAGYFLHDVWHSTHCATRFFLDGPSHVNCLQNKFIYLFGDSTIRQWYSYYVPLVSSKIVAGFDYYFGIKGITLYEKQKTPTVWEPRTAVNEYKNLSIHFAAHGMPLQNGGGRESVPYIADSIDAVQGGPDTVVAFTIGFHLLLYDPSVYVRRLITIREAIGRLLNRSPETIVIFKGLNFYQMDDMFNNQCCLSEWLALRLETIARAIFKEERRMVVLDTWDMTASHYSIPDGLHPTNQIIENEIQLFLSFVCPN